MSDLAPLETLYDGEPGRELLLPPALAQLYGQLRFPLHSGRPYVAGNFVSTLDGVVSLNLPGQSGGGEISGFNQHDQMVMGLLRAVADVVIVGAGTLRAAPEHLWTAAHIYPALADEYAQLRANLGKAEPPLNVVVTARGEIDVKGPLFQSGEVPVLVVTTVQGARQISVHDLPPLVRVEAVQRAGAITARAILDAVGRVGPSELILTEGGPQLIGDFFAEHCLDELFLTLAPQMAGRDDVSERPGLIAGKLFALIHPVWGTLASVKRGDSHLFLRYTFAAD
jgi:riboflavin biosynthesis pyrimidine reductase